jgi:uncharacterized protein
MTGFVLDLATLPAGRSTVVLDCDARGLDLPPADWPGQVRAELGIEQSGSRVSVRGRLAAVARLECVRCLKRFEQAVVPNFEVYAERSGGSRHPNQDDELERDGYMLFHDGRRLDLGPAARELLLLETPIAPHCREDCRGLCPRCGADLNDGPCGCPSD